MQQLTLSIKFTAKPDNKDEFKQLLLDLFEKINKEPNFVNTILSQGIEKPEEFLVYETWNYTIADFMAIQMKKDYLAAFEQSLSRLEIKREPAAFVPFAHYGAQLG